MPIKLAPAPYISVTVVSVCVFGTWMNCAKMAALIKMSCHVTKEPCIIWGSRSPMDGAILREASADMLNYLLQSMQCRNHSFLDTSLTA